jgi:hypothetical protein
MDGRFFYMNKDPAVYPVLWMPDGGVAKAQLYQGPNKFARIYEELMREPANILAVRRRAKPLWHELGPATYEESRPGYRGADHAYWGTDH